MIDPIQQTLHDGAKALEGASRKARAWVTRLAQTATSVASEEDSLVEATRRAVLTAPRDLEALKREIATMRERVREAHPVRPTRFDVKHSRGGMMDAEFAVQWLVLAHSAAHPALQDNAGNIALLQRAEQAGNQHVEDCPQLTEVVLHRCAGQGDALLRPQ